MIFSRNSALAALEDRFDVLVIGGGATGLGIAVDAATRGYRTAQVEAGDFAQATSSRATKLIHGGVRYLAAGQLHLVWEALRERAILARAAPHLVHPLGFVLPVYRRLELPWYGTGLLLYDLLSGKSTMGPTRVLGASATTEKVPGIAQAGLAGSVLYHDAQFNDARLALALARTAADHGAVILNYVRCERLLHSGGRLSGALVCDLETGAEATIQASVVINAAGIFSDAIRRLDNPAAPPLLSLSRGSHIVVDAGILGGSNALMIPKTRDGRVIFAIPWEGRAVIGTTDVAVSGAAMEPGYTEAEIDYLLDHIGPYLAKPISRSDILSVFSGLRPLVTGKAATTSRLSREHHIDLSPTGLITIAGGKWTTYRRMAQDILDFAIHHRMLPAAACVTGTTLIHGATPTPASRDPYLREYGADLPDLEVLIAAEPALAYCLDPELPYIAAQVVYATRFEMARTVEDVLSRRTRALLLNAQAALRAAPGVAALLSRELGRDAAWADDQLRSFTHLARENYSPR